MKKIVVTVCSGEKHEMIGKITQPEMKRYAHRIGAKFAVTRVGPDFGPHPAWAKLNCIYHWLGEYDRVIFLDNDALINADTCPDLFGVVPSTHFGAYVEGVCDSRVGSLNAALALEKIKATRTPSDEDYFNSGVMVVSKQHRDLFTWPDVVVNNYYEQGLLNARVFGYDIPLYKLEYKFNRMSLHDSLTGEERHASHIVHFAGSNDFDRIASEMQGDLERWKNNEPAYTRFYIEAGGGIGDVVEAEPVLRYAITELYGDNPHAEFRIVTAWPRVLEHLSRYPNVIVRYKSMDMIEGVPYCHWMTHPPHHHITCSYFPYHAVHNHDFAALSMLRDVLDRDKCQIELSVNECDWQELKKAGFTTDAFLGPAKKPVAVHAGSGWNSKTFPKDWWQRIVNKLARDHSIILFGNEKCVEVEVPYNGVDLRGKLTLGGAFALLKACPILLTNDSSPVHIGGAFDNWIVMISTCKRPELVFPFRKGRLDYKTISVMNKLTCRPKTLRPNYPHNLIISELEGDIRDYLPTPDEVVAAVGRCKE